MKDGGGSGGGRQLTTQKKANRENAYPHRLIVPTFSGCLGVPSPSCHVTVIGKVHMLKCHACRRGSNRSTYPSSITNILFQL